MPIACCVCSPATCYGGAWGERRYSSNSFSTSALDGGEWSASRSGRTWAPGKGPPVPLYRRRGGPQSQSGHRLEEHSFRLCRGSNLDRPVVHPVARHYSDWATRLRAVELVHQFCAKFFTSFMYALISKKLSRYRQAGANGETMYSSYSFLTSTVARGERSGLLPSCASLPRKGPPVPIG